MKNNNKNPKKSNSDKPEIKQEGFYEKPASSRLREILDEMDGTDDDIDYQNDPRYELGYTDGFEDGLDSATKRYQDVLKSIEVLIEPWANSRRIPKKHVG